MIDGQTFVFFLAGALILNITPGPDMAFTLATSGRAGARAGVAAALGIGAGSLCWALLTAAGLAALLAASHHALTVIRILGGVYLIYLAIDTYRHRHDAAGATGSQNLRAAFRTGVITNLFNPKVGLFYIAFLPGFTDASAGPVWLQTLLLGAIFSVSGVFVLVLAALAAGRARSHFASSPALRSRLNIASAIVFGGLGAALLLTRGK